MVTSFDTEVTVALSAISRRNDDGTLYNPTSTANIRLLFGVSADYSGFGTVRKNYISSIGRVVRVNASSVTCIFTNLCLISVYNRYNSYRAGVLVYAPPPISSPFATIQAVPLPTSDATVIPLTNELYYSAVKDYSPMAANTIFANLTAGDSAGRDVPLPEVRRALLALGSGYNDYVEFLTNTIPPAITTAADWEQNIALWVTDGIQFTSLASLTAYLAFFPGAERFKTSNRGIIRTHYENNSIDITPVFTYDTLKPRLDAIYQPIRTPAVFTGQLSQYNDAGVLVASGKTVTDFATAAQGSLASSAVQSVTMSSGPANGQVTATVNGTAQTVDVMGLGGAAYRATSYFATAEQGGKADTALQTVVLSQGSNPGTLKLTNNGVDQAAVTVPGLGSAAYTQSSAYATAAQGLKADNSVQSITITPGSANGTIQYSVNGGTALSASVTGLGTAAFQPTTAFATPAQGAKADTALQRTDVVDNLQSTTTDVPLSANQGRLLMQELQTFKPTGRPIGGFQTLADAPANSSGYPTDLQPIQVGDTIYIAADVNNGNQHAQYVVSVVGSGGELTYRFVKILPDALRDFYTSPIQSGELAAGSVGSSHIANGAIITADIANGAVTSDKLSAALQTAIGAAGNALQSPLKTSGTGALVSSITEGPDKTLTVNYTNTSMTINTAGTGDFVTGMTANGTTLNINKDGVAFQTISTQGTGNFVTDISASGRALTITKGTPSINLTVNGTGNVITNLTPQGVATKGTVIASATKNGTGAFLTGLTVADGNIAFDTGNAVNALTFTGTGEVISNLSLSGSTLTATRATAVVALPDASTSQAGIVMLYDDVNSTSTTQAPTANVARILNEKIDTNDAKYVKLDGNQTISAAKTHLQHDVWPAKSTVPQNASTTEYATEAQVFTRVAKPATASTNNIAVFDVNRNVVDSGVPYTAITVTHITNDQIDAIWSETMATA
jgi:hypothetical protein